MYSSVFSAAPDDDDCTLVNDDDVTTADTPDGDDDDESEPIDVPVSYTCMCEYVLPCFDRAFRECVSRYCRLCLRQLAINLRTPRPALIRHSPNILQGAAHSTWFNAVR